MTKLAGVYLADSLENVGNLESLGPRFAVAVAFLRRTDLAQLSCGRYELSGRDVYANIEDSKLRTLAEARPEVHREYFDIQVPLTAQETIGVGRFMGHWGEAFDQAKDIGFYPDAPVEPLTLKPGEFAVLWPETCAHAPCCATVSGGIIRKIVVKVRK